MPKEREATDGDEEWLVGSPGELMESAEFDQL